MRWLTAADAWLHPATKRIVAPRGRRGYSVLCHLALASEDDFHLQRQASLSEHATREHIKDHSVPASAHCKRQATPLGLAWQSKDQKSEGYNVSSKTMDMLMQLMQDKKLDDTVFNKLVSSNFKKIGGRDITESTDTAGVDYTVKRGGIRALHQLIVMDAHYAPADRDHSAWLVEAKCNDPRGKENKTPRYSADRTERTTWKQEMQYALAAVADTSPPPAARTGISYPAHFKPDMVDKTIETRKQWVKDLQGQKLGYFECQTPISVHTPLDGDPLLHIHRRADAPPLKRAFIKTAVPLLPHLREFIESMTAARFIRPSVSPFSAPVLVIPKPLNPDGSSRGFRLVTDYRALNAQVDAVQHHIPDVHAMYEKLRHAKYVSTLDLKNGYWNAGLTEESKHLTAFSTEFGTYEYNVVPQGLVCSAAHFQKWVETKLRRHGILFEHVSVNPTLQAGLNTSALFDDKNRYIGTQPIGIAKMKGESRFVAVYIDDLIVFSGSEEEHARHLIKVMEVCSNEKLYLNTSKSHLFCKYTRYLGAICGNGELFMDPKKVEAIMKMPSPTESQTQIREFLGSCSFYRRWIDSYARLTTPLTELLKDTAKGKTRELWDKDPIKYETVIKQLKDALCSYPVLRQPDFDLPFVLYTDASDYAIGGVLCQLRENKMCAIHYVSRSLQGPEKNYSVQEKEALGIIFCVKKFRKMILGSGFKIRCLTDHRSLECLTNSKEVAGRMARWAMIMSEYNYRVEYIKGCTNTAADSLSRLIKIPEGRWTPLAPDDSDSDSEHPFLLLWPETLLLLSTYQQYWAQNDDVGNLSEHDLLMAFTEDHQIWLKKEEKFNHPLCDIDAMEQVLFSRSTVYTGDITVMTVTKELYCKCSDFADLHKYLSDIQQSKIVQSPNDYDTNPVAPPSKRQLALPMVTRSSDTEQDPPQWGLNGPCTDTRQPRGNDNRQAPAVPDVTPKRVPRSVIKAKRKHMHKCKDGSIVNTSELSKKHDLTSFFIDAEHGLLYRVNADDSDTLCVPAVTTANNESIRYHIYMEMHDSPFYGHRGVSGTYNAIRQKFYWPNLRNDIAKWIKSCSQCQNNKIDRTKTRGLMQPVQVPMQPARSYNMDFMTDLPKSYYNGTWYDTCWVFVDRCSHMGFSILCRKDNTAPQLFELFIHELVLRQQRGIPLELIGDRDKTFTSKFFDHAATRLGTAIRLTSARSQQGNGKAERKIASLEEVLRNGINYRQDNWTEIIDYAMFALNDTPDPKLHGRSPLYFERGFNPIKPIDLIDTFKIKGSKDTCPSEVLERIKYIQSMRTMVRDALHDAERNHVAYYNLKRKDDKTIKNGSLVRLNLDHIDLHLFKRRGSKFNPLWFGPFRTIGQPSTVSFRLDIPEDSRIHDTFHVSKLKLATDVTYSQLESKQIHIPTDREHDGDYEVDKILDHDFNKVVKKNGFTSFLIRAIAPCLTHGGSLENISTAPPRFVTHTTTPMAYTSRLKKGEVEESVNVISKRHGRTVSGD